MIRNVWISAFIVLVSFSADGSPSENQGVSCSAANLAACEAFECSVKRSTKMSEQYTVKPKKLLFKKLDSANGALYLKAELQFEYLGLPGDAEPAKYVATSKSYDLDVTGSGKYTQAVSRFGESQNSVIALSPFPGKEKKRKFSTTMTMIVGDSYFKGSPIKIDSDLECVLPK